MRCAILLHAVLGLLLSSSIAERMVLISIDGLHDADLSWAFKYVPTGNLAIMRKNSVVFRKVTRPSSFYLAGLMALTTGASPKLSGVYHYDSYDRDLWPPGTACSDGRPVGRSGTRVLFDESIRDPSSTSKTFVIDATKLPLDASCAPVYPHHYNRAKTIFEVMKESDLNSAWADTHPSAEMLLGPEGKDLDELYIPVTVHPSGSTEGDDIETLVNKAIEMDRLLVDAMVGWAHGKRTNGEEMFEDEGVEMDFMGCRLSTLSVAQQESGATGGYMWDADTPNALLARSLTFLDEQIGRIMHALQQEDALDSASVVVTAQHGFVHTPGSPLDYGHGHKRSIKDLLSKEKCGKQLLHIIEGHTTFIYMNSSSAVDEAVELLLSLADEFELDSIMSGAELEGSVWIADPAHDSRGPDIVATSYPDPDQHPEEQQVGLMIWNMAIARPAAYKREVGVSAVAPTILKLLSVPRKQLSACILEGVKPLPGF